MYRTHKKAGILQCTCRLKKIQIILTEKFNRSITCTNAEMKPGRGGKSFFPPTKDIGTNVGDCVGKGKYFPRIKTEPDTAAADAIVNVRICLAQTIDTYYSYRDGIGF